MAKLTYNRKALYAMKKFLNEASSLIDESTNKPRTCRMTSEYQVFCAIPAGDGETTFTIGYDKNFVLDDDVHIAFRKNFINRGVPSFEDFATITFALLHELGHHVVKKQLGRYDRYTALAECKIKANAEGCMTNVEFNEKYYFNLPDEKAATDWAIEWLKDENHQQIARQFEKKFFASFEN